MAQDNPHVDLDKFVAPNDAKAVRKGAKPLADATDVVNPLLDESPAEKRAANAADYGDEPAEP